MNSRSSGIKHLSKQVINFIKEITWRHLQIRQFRCFQAISTSQQFVIRLIIMGEIIFFHAIPVITNNKIMRTEQTRITQSSTLILASDINRIEGSGIWSKLMIQKRGECKRELIINFSCDEKWGSDWYIFQCI